MGTWNIVLGTFFGTAPLSVIVSRMFGQTKPIFKSNLSESNQTPFSSILERIQEFR